MLKINHMFSFGLLALLLTPMGACQKKPASGLCRTDADCQADAIGKKHDGVCYMGKCEECVEDTDCMDLKQCINNVCAESCLSDADCSGDFHCDGTFCVVDCTDDLSCPGEEVCLDGRCLSRGMTDTGMVELEVLPALEPVMFAFDKYMVDPIYYSTLDNIAEYMKKNPASTMILSGHADKRGTPIYNMVLSERRANAVRDYLSKKGGIATNRIKVVPYGSEKPLVDEENEKAYEQNRRVEFELVVK